MIPTERVQRLAAFTKDGTGGNPAGVVVGACMPSVADMQACALDVGYSETVFAAPERGGWRVRYFSPGCEIPFCGHATLALGAVLAQRAGDGTFRLQLNTGSITVESWREAGEYKAALQSPPTTNKTVDSATISEALTLVGLHAGDLERELKPAIINAGADHLFIGLRDRCSLRRVRYDLEAGRAFMERLAIVTVALAYQSSARTFDVRNLFAAGGVYEDPATGAAAAALAGYLRDTGCTAKGGIELIQGEDMGACSRLLAEAGQNPGSSVRVTGAVAPI